MKERYGVVVGMQYCYVVDRRDGFRIVEETMNKEAAMKAIMIRTSKRLAQGLNQAGKDFSKKFLEKGMGSK